MRLDFGVFVVDGVLIEATAVCLELYPFGSPRLQVRGGCWSIAGFTGKRPRALTAYGLSSAKRC